MASAHLQKKSKPEPTAHSLLCNVSRLETALGEAKQSVSEYLDGLLHSLGEDIDVVGARKPKSFYACIRIDYSGDIHLWLKKNFETKSMDKKYVIDGGKASWHNGDYCRLQAEPPCAFFDKYAAAVAKRLANGAGEEIVAIINAKALSDRGTRAWMHFANW